VSRDDHLMVGDGNPKALAQGVKVLVFVIVLWDRRFKSSWVQTISWGYSAGEVGVLPDPYWMDALHGFEVYLIGVSIRNDPTLKGFLVIKKKKMLEME
jgi:hypothetical protein